MKLINQYIDNSCRYIWSELWWDGEIAKWWKGVKSSLQCRRTEWTIADSERCTQTTRSFTFSATKRINAIRWKKRRKITISGVARARARATSPIIESIQPVIFMSISFSFPPSGQLFSKNPGYSTDYDKISIDAKLWTKKVLRNWKKRE